MKKNNVKFWRNISWLNLLLKQSRQSSLADWMNWPAGEVVALELGDSPTLDQLSQLHESFGLSYQDLISEDISGQQKQVLSFLEEKSGNVEGQASATNYEIPLYAQKASAASVTTAAPVQPQSDNIVRICVPQSFFSAYPGDAITAFEVEGHSMHPSVKSGDIVLGAPIAGIEAVKDGKCYLLLLTNHRLLFKRAYHLPNPHRHSGLQLSSDNLDYHAFVVRADEIEQIWQFTSFLENR